MKVIRAVNKRSFRRWMKYHTLFYVQSNGIEVHGSKWPRPVICFLPMDAIGLNLYQQFGLGDEYARQVIYSLAYNDLKLFKAGAKK